MDERDEQRLRKLCALAATEHDSEKLMALVREMIEVLDQTKKDLTVSKFDKER